MPFGIGKKTQGKNSFSLVCLCPNCVTDGFNFGVHRCGGCKLKREPSEYLCALKNGLKLSGTDIQCSVP